jgi:hypothetical protein
MHGHARFAASLRLRWLTEIHSVEQRIEQGLV